MRNSIIIYLCSCNSSSANDAKEEKPAKNEDGFVNLFEGKTLAGWEGDTAVWRMEDGIVTGEVTSSSPPLKSNTFLIWKGGSPSDFELKGQYKISSEGNSGIQYRSKDVEGVPFGLRGYQFDIDGANQYTGQNYEERGSCIIAFRNQKVTLPEVTKSIQNWQKITFGAHLSLQIL